MIENLAPDPRDVLHSKLVLIWAHNPASTSPHFVPLLREAQRNGAKVVVIDPRRTKTARSADLYIQIKPATDAALALGMMHVIFRRNTRSSGSAKSPASMPTSCVIWQSNMRLRNPPCSRWPKQSIATCTADNRCGRCSACQRWLGRWAFAAGASSPQQRTTSASTIGS